LTFTAPAVPAAGGAAARPTYPRNALISGVPVFFLLAGVLLRYAAYASLHPGGSPQGFADAMCVWDCYWYGEVAQHGYQAYPEVLNFGGPGGIANWAFFPLYPLLLAAAGKLLPLDPAALGAIVSPLLTLGAAYAAWPLFEGNRRGYFLFAALLLAGPFSFYFATAYSESLFLLLTVLAFVALRDGNYGSAGLAGALLSATRTVGVLFAFALLVVAILELQRQFLRQVPRRPDIVLGLLLVPFGLFAFMAWLYFVTGDALAFLHIQRGWDRTFVSPAEALWDALTSPDGQLRDAPVLAFAGIAGLALCGVLVWRREFAAAMFCTLCLMLALTNGVESMLRFVAALAPLGIVLCQLLARHRWLFWTSLASFAALDVEGTILWLHQRGALM
jgi:hypothetical protein